MNDQAPAPEESVHLIVAKDAEVTIEYHPEDWVAFILFWSLAFIVFPAVLHALRPQRQPGLDRGDRALRLDVDRVHRRRAW